MTSSKKYMLFNSCTGEGDCVSKEKIQTFADTLCAIGVANQLTDILNDNDCDPVHLKHDELKTCVENVTEKNPIEINVSVNEKEWDFYMARVALKDADHAKQINDLTVNQSKSDEWFSQKSVRVTASKFKDVIRRKKVDATPLLIES